jgi:hypothetical protein
MVHCGALSCTQNELRRAKVDSYCGGQQTVRGH